MKNVRFLLALFFCIYMQFSLAQSIVSGRVIGLQDGAPIPGAVIYAVGSPDLGTVTDFDGKFSIKIPASVSQIKVSFLGMVTQFVDIAGRSEVEIRLVAEEVALKDVVVTAMGIKREKKALGYEVQEIKGNELTRSGGAQLDNALQGKISGIEIRQSSGMPGASAQILIRGARSLTDNNQPLFVVDGMPIASGSSFAVDASGTDRTNRTSDIDPNDIESINVLKGPAAAALYGMRASNGVVVITTKSGRNQKGGRPVVNFYTNASVEALAKLPQRQETYAQGSAGVYNPYSSTSWGPAISDLVNSTIYGQNTLSIDGQAHPGMYYVPQTKSWQTPRYYENQKQFFTLGNSRNSGMDVSQAGAWGDYALGANTSKQTGVMPSTGMSRHSVRLALNLNVLDKLKLGANANYSNVYVDKQPSGNSYSNPLFALYASPGSYDLWNSPIHLPDQPYEQVNYRYYVDNPRWAIENNRFNEETDRFFGNLNLSYRPLKWMDVHYQLGIDQFLTDEKEVYSLGSGETSKKGKINNIGTSQREINSNLHLTFESEILPDLNAVLMVGNEIVDYRLKQDVATGSQLDIGGIGNISNASNIYAVEGLYKKRTFGIFENLALEYRHLLYFNFSGRTDIVSNMPKDHRTYFYPSASLGFVFTELDALKRLSFLQYGKIRASVAQVGQAGPIYADKNEYVKGGSFSGFIPENAIRYPFNGLNTYIPSSTLNNPNLKPQNTSTYELGTELKFFDGRLAVDYTYSKAIVTNQIFNVPTAASSGYTQAVMNAGKVENIAHDFSLSLVPLKAKDYEFSLICNYSKIKNNVIELAPGVSSLWLGGLDHPSIRAFAGNSYPVIYGSSYLRDSQGRMVINDDVSSPYFGMPIPSKDTIIGTVSPNYQLSFNASLRFRFITISALIDIKNGGQIYSGTNSLMLYYGMDKRTEDRASALHLEGVKGHLVNGKLVSSGQANDVSLLGSSSNVHERYYTLLNTIDESSVYSTSYIKLREVSLRFDLPQSWLAPLKISQASFMLYGRNVWTKTDYPNLDPEVSQGNGNMAGGFEYISLPQVKSFGCGLSLTF